MRVILSTLVLWVFSSAAMADVDSLRTAANEAATAGDTDKAIALLEELLAEAPDDGGAHYQAGTMMMDNGGDLDAAKAHFESAAELGFQPAGTAFRLSRVHALEGNTEAALEQFEFMANNGFAIPALIENEDDYDSIRSEARFTAAMDTIRAARFPCEAGENHHAFDFWIGKWDVSNNGQHAGTNDIQAILGHCVLFEQWTSATGGLGKSFNYYDPAHDHWRQIWISDGGTVIEFTGKARDGGIYYTAETSNPADGSTTYHRFEFTQNDDGSVRQMWATSTDNKASWNTVWDGHYVRQ